MTDETFDWVIENRIEQIKAVLASKGAEYGRADRLHQFKVAAVDLECSPERALQGMAIKHDISIRCLIKDIEKLGNEFSEEYINEKIGDAINYLILLEALIRERYGYVPKEKDKVDGPGPG